MPSPGPVGNLQQAVSIEREGLLDDVFDIGHAGLVFDPAGDRQRGGQGQVGGDADGRVPAVRDQQHAVVVGGPAELAAFGQAAALGQVGLDDIDGAGGRSAAETIAAA